MFQRTTAGKLINNVLQITIVFIGLDLATGSAYGMFGISDVPNHNAVTYNGAYNKITGYS